MQLIAEKVNKPFRGLRAYLYCYVERQNLTVRISRSDRNHSNHRKVHIEYETTAVSLLSMVVCEPEVNIASRAALSLIIQLNPRQKCRLT
jgi:hypothetical protein